MNRALATISVLTLALCGVEFVSNGSGLFAAQEVTARRSLSPTSAPTPLTIEFESLAASANVSGGDVIVQLMSGFGPGWGGDAQLFWRAPAPADQPIRNYPHLSMLFAVPVAGTYELTLQFTRAPDYGRFTVAVGGSKLLDVDGYGSTVALGRQSLGQKKLLAGDNQIVFTVFGKAGTSSGYIVGLDRLELISVSAAIPAGRKVSPKMGVKDRPANAAAPAGRTQSSEAAVMAGPATSRPSTTSKIGEGSTLSQAEPGVATHLVGEHYRPRLEARVVGPSGGRRGFETHYEPRRLRLDWNRQNLNVGFRWFDPAGAPGGRWEIYSSIPSQGQSKPLASGPLPAIAAGLWQDFERDLTPYKPADPLAFMRNLPVSGTFNPGALQPRLFLQVRATSAQGQPLGEPTNFIELKFSSEPMGKLKKPSPSLSLALVNFQPVKPYEERFLCWAVATKDGPPLPNPLNSDNLKGLMWHKGDKRNDLCDHKSSGGILGFFEAFANAFVGAILSFVDAVGSAINQVSAFYSEVKDGFVDLAAGPLTAIGCDACRSIIELGCDAALASVGVPPSLPNFAQVVQGLEQGSIDTMTDILVETAVSQGLPVDQIPMARDAARRAVAELVSQAEKAAASAAQGGGNNDGWAPDLSRAYSPAVMVFEIRNHGPVKSKPMNLQLIDLQWENVDFELPGLFFPQRLSLGGYAPVWLAVPVLQPGTSIRVAVTLLPEADPHLWLDLIYGRSSLLPPQEWCDKDFGEHSANSDPQKLADCKARMLKRSQFNPYALNSAWGKAYGSGVDSFELRLFRFGDMGNTEGVEARLYCDGTGLCHIKYNEPSWLGKRLDMCLANAGSCGGEPVAQAFCKRLGYPVAVGAEGAYDIGPTLRLDDGSRCSDPGCDGFAYLTCGNMIVAEVVKP